MNASTIQILSLVISWELVWAVIVNQRFCPEPIVEQGLTEVDCDFNIIYWELEAVARIPAAGNTMNLFYIPYGPMSCVRFRFYCRLEQQAFGDLYVVPNEDTMLVCPSMTISRDDNKWRVIIASNPYSKLCNGVEKWLDIDFFIYRQNDYILAYACREHIEHSTTEFAAWILVNVESPKERKKEVLNIGIEMFEQILGLKRQWFIYPEQTSDCYKKPNCSYYADCLVQNTTDTMEQLGMAMFDYQYILLAPVTFILIIAIGLGIVKINKMRDQTRVIPYNSDSGGDRR